MNTVTARNAEPVDWLTGYPRLLQWASLTGEFDPGTLRALRRLSADAPAAATAALHATRELREALHDVTSAIIRNDPAPADPLRRIERTWKDAVREAELTFAAGNAQLQLTVETSGLAYLNHELALRSARATPGPAARAHPHLPGSALRLAVHRPLQRRPATLVRHGHLR